jgi:hypothetical protein
MTRSPLLSQTMARSPLLSQTMNRSPLLSQTTSPRRMGVTVVATISESWELTPIIAVQPWHATFFLAQTGLLDHLPLHTVFDN